MPDATPARGVVSPLRTLFWEVTLRCNAGCAFCGSRCVASGGPEVGGDAVCRAFETVAEAYDPRRIMVNVTGGEPLLRKDLFDVMGRIRDLGFPWGMVTNGSLIDDEAIRSMRETGMRTISVSIDGLREAHEKARRLPGAFPRIVEAIRKLGRESFLDTIQVTTVVTSDNFAQLDGMLEFLRELPVDSWRIALVDPIGRCADQQGLLLGTEGLQRYFAFMDRHRFSPKPVILTSCSHYLGDRDTLYRPHPFRCEAGRSVASILADGSIFVCPNVPRDDKLIQGNILHDDLVEVWEGGFGWFRDDASRRVGECASCPEWDRCKGDSLHTWDFDAGRPNFCIRHLGRATDERENDGQTARAQAAAGRTADKQAHDGRMAEGQTADGRTIGAQEADGLADDGRATDGRAVGAQAAGGRTATGQADDGKPAVRHCAIKPPARDLPSPLKVVRISYGSSSDKVAQFSPEAAAELHSYFHWGKAHPANVCEQMVAAVGWMLGDDKAWVEELVPVPLVERDRKTARVREDMHDYVTDEIAVMNRGMDACDGYGAPFQFLGYIHSHPGELSATMSLPDLELASWLNEREGHDCLAGVVNPQKGDLCVYWDSAFSPVDVELCVEERDVGVWA